MNEAFWSVHRRCALGVAGLALGLQTAPSSLAAQQDRRVLDSPAAAHSDTPPRRTRLILKDGSYQLVLSYAVKGSTVRYRSAERNGEEEELPLALVDLPATEAWARAHDPSQPPAAQQAPVLSPELAREEAARAARSPEVAKDLRLPEENSVLALDTYEATPELVPLPQQGGDLNHETAHAVLKKDLNPVASPHNVLFLKGERADVQLHVADPVFFVRLEGKNAEEQDAGGSAFVVDTQGQTGRATPGGGSGESRYVIERLGVGRGERGIDSFQLRLLGGGRAQADVIETRAEPMPGGVWERLVPTQPLEFGEYALVEVLNDRALNLDVWDFGVHPTAKENDEALRPEPKRPAQLERRRRTE